MISFAPVSHECNCMCSVAMASLHRGAATRVQLQVLSRMVERFKHEYNCKCSFATANLRCRAATRVQLQVGVPVATRVQLQVLLHIASSHCEATTRVQLQVLCAAGPGCQACTVTSATASTPSPRHAYIAGQQHECNCKYSLAASPGSLSLTRIPGSVPGH